MDFSTCASCNNITKILPNPYNTDQYVLVGDNSINLYDIQTNQTTLLTNAIPSCDSSVSVTDAVFQTPTLLLFSHGCGYLATYGMSTSSVTVIETFSDEIVSITIDTTDANYVWVALPNKIELYNFATKEKSLIANDSTAYSLPKQLGQIDSKIYFLDAGTSQIYQIRRLGAINETTTEWFAGTYGGGKTFDSLLKNSSFVYPTSLIATPSRQLIVVDNCTMRSTIQQSFQTVLSYGCGMEVGYTPKFSDDVGYLTFDSNARYLLLPDRKNQKIYKFEEYSLCNGIEHTDPRVCSGNGTCLQKDVCTCKAGGYGRYIGQWCEQMVSQFF